MKEFWSARARSLTPYVPGEQPQGQTFIKLNTNENPYPPSPAALAAIRAAADGTLRLYPDPECAALRQALAETYGLNFDYLHTDGSAEQTVQLAGGHAQVGLTTYGGAATLIEQGKIVPLAICAEERSASLPDVPTMAECGYDFVYGAWRGFGVPAGTPDEVVQILSDALKTVMETDSVIQAFEDSGFPVAYLNAEDFQTMMDNDYQSMSDIYYLLEE